MTIDETQRTELIRLALEARQRAYAPYSHYRVGAALLTPQGDIFQGANVENAVYPTSMCAERTALFKAVSEGHHEFLAIAIATENGGSPCGACRQALSEFGLDLQVYTVDGQGRVVLDTTLRALLPQAFGPDDLSTD